MENILENKIKFFSQYFFQRVLKLESNKELMFVNEDTPFRYKEFNGSYLQLKSLKDISDEDAIEVAKICHQIYNDNWQVVKRDNDLIHIEYRDSINTIYHISILYKYAAINANHHFLSKKEGGIFKSYKVNIGELRMSSSKPIGYIYALDYLRSKGYLIPFMDLSVENIINYGWAKIN